MRARRARELAAARATTLSIALVVLGTLVSVVAAFELAGDSPRARLLATFGLMIVGLVSPLPLGHAGFRASLGGRPRARDLALAVVFGIGSLGFALAYVVGMSALSDPVDGDAPQVSTGSALLLMAVLPAVVEEWLCRGVLWTACRRALDTRWSVVTTALVFAFLHGLNGTGPLEFPHRFVAGLLFGALRARSGSLVPSMLAHFTNNALAVLLG